MSIKVRRQKKVRYGKRMRFQKKKVIRKVYNKNAVQMK